MTAMAMGVDAWKHRVWEHIDAHRDKWLGQLREMIRRPSDNPPGDTTKLADYLEGVLRGDGFPVLRADPLKGAVNLVSSQGAGGKHLMLNGHLDVFPVEDASRWQRDPYDGGVYDGWVYGRGAADMKGGSSALVAAYRLMRELNVPLGGKLSIMLVSDEETGGRWGTQWLLENHPELLADAVLSAEPSTTEAVNIGEKGICWIQVRATASGGHGGLGQSSVDENAILKMMKVFEIARTLVGKKGDLPPAIAAIVPEAKAFLEEQPYGKGHSWVLDSISLNVGRIDGGVKVNVVPAFCDAEIDYRVPPGFTCEQVHEMFQDAVRAAGITGVSTELVMNTTPSYTLPTDPVVEMVRQNATAVTGKRPRVQLMYGGTDVRFFRYQGKPAAIYGPRAHNMGAPDEKITVDDYFAVLKTHAASIIDYLGVV